MVYPQSGSPLPRHPSSLYQFLLEGLLLFVVLWFYAKKPRGLGQVSGVFLIGYGVLRFIAEFFREPDDFLGLSEPGAEHGAVAVRADGDRRASRCGPRPRGRSAA